MKTLAIGGLRVGLGCSGMSGTYGPAHAAEWQETGIEAHFEGVCGLVVEGLRAR